MASIPQNIVAAQIQAAIAQNQKDWLIEVLASYPDPVPLNYAAKLIAAINAGRKYLQDNP